ncbi:MAG: anti-sigma factor [Thermomicrobiales bacterium]
MALGALDSDEEEQTLSHVRSSMTAREELRAFEELAGDLSLAVERATPPPQLRDRILQRTAPTEPARVEPERVTRLSPPVWIGTLAAAVLILALAAIALTQWSSARDRGDTIDDLRSEIVSQNARIAELETAAASAGAFIDFEEPLVWTELSAPAPGRQSPGFLARTPDGQTAYLVLTGVEIDAEHVFQAWLIEDTPVSVGTLRTSNNGLGFLILKHQGEPIQEFNLIGVTIEPPGGSPQPTSDPIVVGEIV